MSRRMLALLATSVSVGAFLVSAPAVVVAAPHVAKPTSVSIQSSYAKVTSSTKQPLHVVLEASNNPSTPVEDTVVVGLSKGLAGQGESHSWTLPISSSVLSVDSSGAGTLKVPAKDIAPFGDINLTIAPIGKITSKSCEGTVISKSAKVSLSGVFFFDSKSTGAHAWGAVGSKKKFAFAATNTLTWLYSSAVSENCIKTLTPCGASVFWTAQDGSVSLDGDDTTKTSSVLASRSASLSKPTGATRDDSNVGPTKPPVLETTGGGNATLSVDGAGSGVTGSATLTSSQPETSSPSTPCGNGKTESSDFWSGTYANGSSPLTVSEQIYGALTLGANGNGLFGRSTNS
jgi:hypothetical protein